MTSIPVKIKMCGMTRPEDAEKAAELGADSIGMVLSEGDAKNNFNRYVSKRKAIEITDAVPDDVGKVGVFVNEEPDRINSLVEILDLDFVQLHGEEKPEAFKKIHCDIIKAVKVSGIESIKRLDELKVNGFLFDSQQGGSGKPFEWEILKNLQRKIPWFLAGGLNPDNVVLAIKKVHPDWVDVSSGIEGSIRGEKDIDKMKRFIEAVKSVE